ncbi:hypothetical protein [Sinomonas soli]
MSKQQHDQGVKKRLARRKAAAASASHEQALRRARRSSWPYRGLAADGPHDGQ